MLKTIFTAMITTAALVMGFVAQPASAASTGDGFAHHVVFHVDQNDKQVMNMTMNNAANVTKYYAAKGQKVKIEIVAYGPGLNMLVAGKSHVEQRLAKYTMQYENVSFAACGNTIKGMTKKSGGKVPQLIKSDSISVVPSGVVQIIKRQDQNWHYIRP